MGSEKIQAAIIGSGNIGTDLMFKIMKNSQYLSMGAMIGIARRFNFDYKVCYELFN